METKTEPKIEPKYELTHTTLDSYGYTGFVIRALKDFGDVKKGDLGGAVQSEANLSQEGNCWIYPGSLCVHKARVLGNSTIMGKSLVAEKAQVYGNARVAGHSEVRDTSIVCGYSTVTGTSVVKGKSIVYRHAIIHNTRVEDSFVGDNANLDECTLFHGATVKGDALCAFEHFSACVITENELER